MPAKTLHIAWIGAGPGEQESGGAPGVATELLDGLANLGHRIDCFFPGKERAISARLAAAENLTFIWGTSGWRWNRWYSKTRLTAFASGLVARGFASLRLRRAIARRHRHDPYDVLFQFSNIESLAAPSRLRRTVPVVIMPSTHMAGELRWLLAERRLAFRCQPRHTFAVVATIRLLRVLVQRVAIRRADLLVCISSVFRDHLVRDYRFPLQRTTVIPNPVRIERFEFADRQRPLGSPATILVLGRVAVRKGVEDVIALAHLLRERGVDAQIRVIGGPDLSSDYTCLLEDLPPENSHYVGRIAPSEVPAELAGSDLLLQASKYEPFGLTVAEALAAGVPVVASEEVGAVEGIDPAVAAVVAPGDVEGMAAAIVQMLARLRGDAPATRSLARAEAERRYAPQVVCAQLEATLQSLLAAEQGRSSTPGAML
jgi:glycosyltransferase involved in cell wall biosynthesis